MHSSRTIVFPAFASAKPSRIALCSAASASSLRSSQSSAIHVSSACRVPCRILGSHSLGPRPRRAPQIVSITISPVLSSTVKYTCSSVRGMRTRHTGSPSIVPYGFRTFGTRRMRSNAAVSSCLKRSGASRRSFRHHSSCARIRARARREMRIFTAETRARQAPLPANTSAPLPCVRQLMTRSPDEELRAPGRRDHPSCLKSPMALRALPASLSVRRA